MQTASFSIWTMVTESSSYDDNSYTKSASDTCSHPFKHWANLSLLNFDHLVGTDAENVIWLLVLKLSTV